jgi:hypothetical protein
MFAVKLVLLLAAATSPALAADTANPWRRWAVVCSQEPRENGLGDLLTVELGKAAGIELVERERLAAVESELEISALLGSAAGGRLQLGRMLRADALVLISRGGKGADEPYRLVIAECAQGARLHHEEFKDSQEAGARHVAKVVGDTRARFPAGITLLLAVPNFVSRNLIHDFDTLQAGYAGLLAGTLSLQQGTTVLEIEEARSIVRELVGQPMRERRVPLLVEGEFRMDGPAGNASTKTTLTVRLTGGSSSQHIVSPALAVADAPRWIADELAGRVLRQAGVQSPLKAGAQYKLLVARADEFSSLGAFEQAVPLREAALLLDPSASELSTRLIAECQANLKKRLWVSLGSQYPRSPEIREKYGPAVDMCLAMFEHMEFLIRNRQIDRNRALGVVRLALPRTYDFPNPFAKMIVGDGRLYYVGQEELARAQKPVRRFFLEVMPKVLGLPPPAGRPVNALDDPNFIDGWASLLLEGVSQRTDVPYRIPKDLDDILRAYTRILPESVTLDFLSNLPRYQETEGARAATEADYETLYHAMAESKHRVASLHGRYLLLRSRFEAGDRDPATLRAILSDLEKLRADCREVPTLHGHATPHTGASGWFELERFWGEVASGPVSAPMSPPQRSRVLTGPLDNLRAGLSPAGREPQSGKPAPTRSTGAVRFSPVSLQLKRLDGRVEEISLTSPAKDLGRRLSVLRCAPEMDLHWNSQVLLVMRRPGVLQEIFSDDSVEIERVAWDGRDFWLAMKDGTIRVVGADGSVRAHVLPSHGLPPSTWGPFSPSTTRSPLLHPLDPGRVIALGSFGDPVRAWAATVQLEDSKPPSVKAFFEAKGVRPPKDIAHDAFQPLTSIDLGFYVDNIHAYRAAGQPEPSILLVARRTSLPLAVDLRTLAVSIFGCQYDWRAPNIRLLDSHNGVLFADRGGGLELIAPPGKPWPDGKFTRRVSLVNPPSLDPADIRKSYGFDATHLPGGGPALFDPGDGYLYWPGKYWQRIELKTLTGQLLSSTSLPMPYGSETSHFGVSAHYGLSGWIADSFHRITINEADIPRAGDPLNKATRL